MIQTKNFNPKTDPKLLCTCGHILCDERSVNQITLNRVQLVRNDINQPLPVNSGGRCPYHQDEQNRTTPADHQLCQVVDVGVSGGHMRGAVVRSALTRGFNAIGIAKTFVHLGYREDCKLVMWVYQ